MIDLHRRPDENERQYIWRIGQYVDGGEIPSWKDVTPTLNAELRESEDEYRDESAYRKPYQYAKGFYVDVFSAMNSDTYLREVQKQQDELYKARTRLYDQRREYRKNLVVEARGEHLMEELVRAAKTLNTTRPLVYIPVENHGEEEAILVLNDWHYGMITHNIWNIYDIDICRARVAELASRVIEYLKMHHPRKLYIVLLGDAAHGAIHVSARVASEEETCDQLMQVSELIAELIDACSHFVPETEIDSTYGNHLRTVQDKDDSIHSDNMEKVIPWWLKQRFKERRDVYVVDSPYEEFILISPCGCNICATHGDEDNVKTFGVTANMIFTKKTGKAIDYTINGDKHHVESNEAFSVESILVPALCGVDDYADDKRKYSTPGQALFFVRNGDLESRYILKFKDKKDETA